MQCTEDIPQVFKKPVSKVQRFISPTTILNDSTNNYIHEGVLPTKHIRNVENPVIGYPKLQRLFDVKEKQISTYAIKPLGCRTPIPQMIEKINSWVNKDKLVFDVVMIGSLTENQLIYPLLAQLPLHKLISKPGFLFVWASAQKIHELSKLLNTESWAKKFRRSEELVFVPVDKNSPFYPHSEQGNHDDILFERMQWHCWMCITGTVRRSTDGHLIHCNVDTDLTVENQEMLEYGGAVPSHLYKTVENFSTATRRLHIIPSRTGSETPVRMRPGWVIMSPDILVDNFDATKYKQELDKIGTNLPKDAEIENLRPKSPVPQKAI